jgi:hypothetical protein
MLRKQCRPQAGRCVEALFGEGAADAKLDLLKLGERRGVRDLAVLDDGILVLAGPTADKGESYAFWWDGEGDSVRFLRDLSNITRGERERKPRACWFSTGIR